ncbi:hypothetical protein DNU06_00290 [Putridiphycobacter roseus]|uniref:Insulinase family protein n=1 Tax=Putridiphycobacter roseus TaxID=2219161 RepID=A0A2W1NU76_9FLAO|nr:pitrilysin family protein [Putridiphycobacter roseus]PZE18308.1 hypothetical protein DNU06_00290 [Putridiphycobacter roseus]
MNRSIPPKLNPIKTAHLLFPKQIQLKNNLDFYWLDEVHDQTIKLDFVWDAGSKYEDKKLISKLCNKLLLSGTNTLNALTINEQIDALGGYVNFDHNADHGGFTIFGLQQNINAIVKIVLHAFDQVVFDESEIHKLIEIEKKNYDLNIEKVNVLARRAFNQQLFGEGHYYAKNVVPADFENIKQKEIVQFYTENYQAKQPAIFLVGQADNAFLNQLDDFSASFPNHLNSFQPKVPKQQLTTTHIPKEKAVQTAIRIGKLCIDKNQADYTHFQMMNTILGGYFGSRLMKNIREEKGYTYGIGSGISTLENATYFFIATEVGKENMQLTIDEIFSEMKILSTTLVSEEELKIVKNYLLGSFLKNADGPIPMMEKFKNIYFAKLPENYYSNYFQKVQAATPADILNVAKKYLKPDSFTIVTAG